MNERVEASPMKNLTGGGGCGCGCLGLLIALGGGLALALVPLGFYAEASSAPLVWGIGGVVSGIVLFLFGTSVYVGSLFLE
ncbi:MAG: hypothetical protein ABMA64_05290 [Myxococcota bacterium]